MVSIGSQSWAVTRRYWATSLKSPIKNCLRGLIWPIAVLWASLSIVFDPGQDKEHWVRSRPANSIPTVVLFLIIFNIYHFAEWLVSDKATGIKSLMHLMGLRRSSYYFGSSLIITGTILPVIFALAIISLVHIFHDSNSSVLAILLVFVMFSIQLTGLIFLISSFISSTNYVAFVVIIFLLESQTHTLVLWLMERTAQSLWPIVLFIFSISPIEALRIFCNSYSLCKNCDATKFEENNVSQRTYLILTAMTLWTIVMFSFAHQLEKISSWQTLWMVIKKMGTCCCETKPNNILELDDVTDITLPEKAKFFEPPMRNREIGIYLSKLTKIYRSIPVVDDVTFNVYNGETTLLLGHNGAGKTTLMNMILGELTPEKGRVSFPDQEEAGNEEVRIGVCPQTSILDEGLTVREHLELFADIKTSSMSAQERELHINQTIEDVSLTPHQRKLPSELSGGMRRKLSLALAFVGQSSVLILDEPSSGLDPDSRVFIWNAIRRYRKERTVLLSTQHMEEADYLGDRIAIMSAGKMICCGSSTFLNNTFGTGYKLRVECVTSKRNEVLALTRKYFPAAKVAESDQLDIYETKPSLASSRSTDRFSDLVIELKVGYQSKDWEANLIVLLEDIETNGAQLHIRSHSLKSSSIEDVLLQTSKSFSKPETSHSVTIQTSDIQTTEALVFPRRSPTETTFVTQKRLLLALIIKHAQTYRRNIINTIFFRLIAVTLGAYLLVRNFTTLRYDYAPNLTIVTMVMYFVYLPTLERATNFKTVQLASELKFVTYWLAHLLTDLLTVGIQVLAVIIFMLTTLPGEYVVSAEKVIAIASLAVVLFGISSALMAYILSTFLRDARRAIGVYIFLLSLSLLTYIFFVMLSVILGTDSKWLIQKSVFVFVAFMPNDALLYIYHGFGKKCYIRSVYTPDCYEADMVSPVMVGLIGLMFQVVGYSFLLYWIERGNYDLAWYFRWRNLPCFGSKQRQVDSTPQQIDVDEDVLEEKLKAARVIGAVPNDTYSLIAADLSKSYIKDNKVISHLSFTVNKNECLGLLGINGAGKSTTFSMIAADIKPDEGRIWLNGNYMNTDIDNYRLKLGYDPQQNPDMLLTPSNALYLMARLRCMEEGSIPDLVQSTLEILEMSQHANKVVRNLSGGTKRKLALGMSIIGTPSMLALDEPTAGVDPMARRNIWHLLRTLRAHGGSSILISSHAMEECEAICDRIAIMAQGRLRCIGSFLHLRSKFSQGCTIKLHSSVKPVDGMEDSAGVMLQMDVVQELYQNLNLVAKGTVKLTDSNVNSATFHVADNKVPRSRLFIVLREFKSKHSNLSYSINDSSLEDIFIAFAREQQQLEHQQPTNQKP